MAIETFSWPVQIQAQQQISYSQRVRSTQFGDGYEQVAADGINPETIQVPITWTGSRSEALTLRDFLRRHTTKSFIFTPPFESKGLYRVAPDSINLVPVAANVATVTRNIQTGSLSMIKNDIQKLEPGNKIRLISVDGTAFGADILRFHASTIPHTPEEIAASGGDESKLKAKSLWFDGKEYGAFPFEVEGLETSSDGQTARPTLRVADLDGVVTALCLHFDDMAQAKVTIIDTLVHYLDAKNFPEGNPTADASQCFKQVFFIDRKVNEVAGELVEFELSSPMDLQGLVIPTRQISAICTWACRNQYRTGNGCSYNGPNMFDLKGNPVTDPSQDKCSGLLADCKKRFGADAQLDFGGFPGASLIRR